MGLRRPRTKRAANTISALYSRFNKLYWDNTLPTAKLVLLPAGQAGQVVNGACDWGGCQRDTDGSYLIELREVDWSIHVGFLKANLLHEMLHVEIGPDFDHRSKEWRTAVRRLSRRGALKETI